ncbi:hypothetical protein BCR34DRAFT_654658 [Clohesyomyces aquaticus]|uniref:Uncharacterized protein n=1 Tax=Clohesyomyces aquaticus TaxID=1231657 RepID=A0A1Y1ZK16_9PLEO|nr:hypothetical protein BCR34DRAFT_654658 [Clohesyomyces aquaticus]
MSLPLPRPIVVATAHRPREPLIRIHSKMSRVPDMRRELDQGEENTGGQRAHETRQGREIGKGGDDDTARVPNAPARLLNHESPLHLLECAWLPFSLPLPSVHPVAAAIWLHEPGFDSEAVMGCTATPVRSAVSEPLRVHFSPVILILEAQSIKYYIHMPLHTRDHDSRLRPPLTSQTKLSRPSERSRERTSDRPTERYRKYGNSYIDNTRPRRRFLFLPSGFHNPQRNHDAQMSGPRTAGFSLGQTDSPGSI